MKFYTLIFIFTFTAFSAAQVSPSRLDSLFNLYVKIKNIQTAEGPVSADTSITKCAFSSVNDVRLNFDKFSAEQKVVLAKLFSRPVTQTSKISPAGLYTVHYDTSGVQAVKYDVNAFLRSLDSVYDIETRVFGYPAAPSVSGIYDIFIINTGSLYGYTELEDNITDHTYYSFIVLDNDFASTNTKGLNGARVTIAHEYHHAIQLGNYVYSADDIFFHELSSTAMEEFVYNYINDYYYYMDEYFNAPDVSFPTHSGYDLAIWNIFLAKRFDMNLLKRQWEILYGKRALEAIAISIGERNSNFQDEFNQFGIWTYFTNFRSIQGKYFEEAEHYPAVDYLINKPLDNGIDSMNLMVQPVSHNYLTLTNNNSGQPDTLTILISNSDFRQAISNPDEYKGLLYEVSTDSTTGLTQLVPGYYSKFTPGTISAFWAASEFLNNQLIKEGFVRVEGSDPFPSPFKYSRHSYIYIPAKVNPENDVELQVYSSSMDLVYNSRKDIFRMFGKDIVSWNGKDSDNKRLGSGVYVYVIKSGDDISTGKIVIFND